MRFDDSLKTVLAADTSSSFGAQSAFRQLVDLMGRGRIVPDEATIARLRGLRADVPATIRAASARALALANPPAALVAFFAEDEPAIAAPVLRIAALDDAAWSAILGRLGPTGRSVLRDRRDLSVAVRRGLDSFGATDFTIGFNAPVAAPIPVDQPTAPPRGTSPFVALGMVARELPIVAEALRRSERREPERPPAPGFEIAELVDRIENFQRERAAGERAAPAPLPGGFRFETDADGAIRWVEGVARGALVGLSLARGGGPAAMDGMLAGAVRQRTAFADARLTIAGASDAAGDWRVSGVPIFDPATGRFLGMRGQARRPRADQDAGDLAAPGNRAGGEALRRLVHELRTPTNAISGFAELIESEMLGQVPAAYRDRAATIRGEAADLIGAIDDLDTAARIESGALELRAAVCDVLPILEDARAALLPLAALRGCTVEIEAGEIGPGEIGLGEIGPGEIVTGNGTLAVLADDRATARLVSRLLAALVSAGGAGERIVASITARSDTIEIAFTRPAALANVPDHALLSIDADGEEAPPGAPLLGTGFALRLARNLARELGGSLAIGATRLTLRLPAGFNHKVQASNS